MRATSNAAMAARAMAAVAGVAATALILLACGGGSNDGAEGAGGTRGRTGTTEATGDPTRDPVSEDLRLVELDERRTRWASQEPTSYRFTIAQICFCPTEYVQPR